ncbi:MAG: tRNA uridine-5-carboxymethylaminomethyl(34) synthesis GTPase MnmE [Lautropia sp.]|nr:tRNA uridine-5-carboxymethylaminomethyl(34) synthesis GTPase MnmE [Lautropia sp.]
MAPAASSASLVDTADSIARHAYGRFESHPAPMEVEGPDSSAGVSTVSRRVLKPRSVNYGPFLAADAQPIDYGLTVWFPAPHSYTGEHVLEFQGHGGPVVQQILLKRVLEVGTAFDIRLAEPGEFTERAFLNDKLDLVQAEAVADLIEASTEQAARSATRSLQGVFSDRIDALAEQMLHLRMLVEATLDFPEEEIEFLERADACGQLDAIERTLQTLFDTARSGARLRQGLNVVLTGAPNVGKSSLLNALAGAEVAIVTPIAGTTRDRVIEQISIEGVPINLIDTAGLRDTDDVVERIGIERTWAEIEKADVVVHLQAADGLAIGPAPFGERKNVRDTEEGVRRSAVAEPAVAEKDHLESSGASGAAATRRVSDIASSGAATPVRIEVDETLAERNLIEAINARVPARTRQLTVINKIDLLADRQHIEQGAGVASTMTDGSTASQLSTGESVLPSSTTPVARLAEARLVARSHADSDEVLWLSARTGEGIEAFRRKLLEIAGFQPGSEGVFIARERHLQALQQALTHLGLAREHLHHGDQSLDLFAEELRLAHNALGRITGAVSADELLGVIFSRFCIGK